MLRRSLIALAALAAVLPSGVQAESSQANGAGTLSTTARLDFQVTVPRFLMLRIGTAGGTVDLIDFDLGTRLTAGGFPGDGVDVAATAGSGDLGNGSVTARVASNAGQISLTATANAGGLTDGGANAIPFTEILTATDNADLPAPTLIDGTSSAVNVTLTGGNRTDRSATWTYSFDNANSYESGVYGGANVNGGRVTYTASSP